MLGYAKYNSTNFSISSLKSFAHTSYPKFFSAIHKFLLYPSLYMQPSHPSVTYTLFPLLHSPPDSYSDTWVRETKRLRKEEARNNANSGKANWFWSTKISNLIIYVTKQGSLKCLAQEDEVNQAKHCSLRKQAVPSDLAAEVSQHWVVIGCTLIWQYSSYICCSGAKIEHTNILWNLPLVMAKAFGSQSDCANVAVLSSWNTPRCLICTVYTHIHIRFTRTSILITHILQEFN